MNWEEIGRELGANWEEIGGKLGGKFMKIHENGAFSLILMEMEEFHQFSHFFRPPSQTIVIVKQF